MELRRIRRAAHGGHPCRTPGLATVSRRLSRRRVNATGRRACGQSGEASARDSRQRVDLLERAHFARTKCALARSGTCGWQVLPAEHCELERAWLRTQLVPASNSTMERHKSRELLTDSRKKQWQHLPRRQPPILFRN